jgi:hypothetical protein
VTRAVLLAFVALAACEDDGSSDGGMDARVIYLDGGWRDTSVPRSPDGEGYCCERGGPSCNCTPLGGFTTDPDECVLGAGRSICDLHPDDFIDETDEHGCRRWGYRYGGTDCTP